MWVLLLGSASCHFRISCCFKWKCLFWLPCFRILLYKGEGNLFFSCTSCLLVLNYRVCFINIFNILAGYMAIYGPFGYMIGCLSC